MLASQLAGALLLLDPGTDHLAVDVHFTAKHRGACGQGKPVEAVHRLGCVLVKDLIDLDAQQVAAHVKLALDALERQMNPRLL